MHDVSVSCRLRGIESNVSEPSGSRCFRRIKVFSRRRRTSCSVRGPKPLAGVAATGWRTLAAAIAPLQSLARLCWPFHSLSMAMIHVCVSFAQPPREYAWLRGLHSPNHPARTAVARVFASTATYAGAMCPGMRPLARPGFSIGTGPRRPPYSNATRSNITRICPVSRPPANDSGNGLSAGTKQSRRVVSCTS